MNDSKFEKFEFKAVDEEAESGRIGYLVLWLLGAPVGLLLVLWVFFGNNLIGPG